MHLDTPVRDRFQEQFEQAVRDVLGGISQADRSVCRELPPPRQETSLDLTVAPELDAVALRAFPAERTLGVTLYFDAQPEGDVPAVPAGSGRPASGALVESAPTTTGSPTHLAELGGGYEALSDAVVETLARYCGVPADARDRLFVGERPDLLCTGRSGDGVAFATYVAYPEHVERVYGDGRADLATRYGLPF